MSRNNGSGPQGIIGGNRELEPKDRFGRVLKAGDMITLGEDGPKQLDWVITKIEPVVNVNPNQQIPPGMVQITVQTKLTMLVHGTMPTSNLTRLVARDELGGELQRGEEQPRDGGLTPGGDPTGDVPGDDNEVHRAVTPDDEKQD